MKSKNKISIKWKLLAGIAVFVVFVLLLLWFLQIVFLDDFYKGSRTVDVKNAAQTVADHIADSNFEELLAQIASEHSMSILITDSSANTLYLVNGFMSSTIHNLTLAEKLNLYYRAKQEGGVLTESFQIESDLYFPPTQSTIPHIGGFRREQDEGILYTTVIESENDDTVIFVDAQITPVDATVSTLMSQLIWITCILIVVSVLFALIMTKIISRPIVKINESAKKLAKADYEVTFDEKGYKEISELAGTLNYAARELSKIDSLQRELIANVSHDLRTPLTLICGYGEIMRDLPGENKPENVQIIIDEAKRLSCLVSDMLDLSKLQSDAEQIHNEVFGLTDMIRNLIQRYSKLMQQDGYVVCFEYDQDICICGDELKLSQVVYNLINNAINYCGEDKKVIVKQTVIEDKVRIDVIDHGKGIAAEDLSYVWDRYFKSKETHKRAVVGTGLGLSIVKKILTLHSAAFGVQSRLGEGSDFWFELKLQEENQEWV